MKSAFFIFSLLLFFITDSFSQNGFRFYGKNKNTERVKFKLINNLIIIPLEINGKELSFILDTGVNKTILFSLYENDSVGLNNIKQIKLNGLGTGEPVDALISENNRLRINDLISNNEPIYVILNNQFDLSSKMGITIHGIIGYTLLENVIAKINYRAKKIDFYNPETYQYSKCRKCDEFPIKFYRDKPFIDLQVQLDTLGNEKTNVKMLIDSGGSEAIWLFENSQENIKTPKRFFRDILGEGLSGTIYGNRSRIPAVKFGRHTIKSPTVSFLDSLSTLNARNFKQRNGSLGGNILKRFKIWIDYPNKKLTIRKNSSLRGGFNYNMSGLDVVYNGQQLIKESVRTFSEDSYTTYNKETNQSNTISLVEKYQYIFKNSYKINYVLKDSPADLAGLLKGDVILKLNRKHAYDYKMSDITEIFQSYDNKKITMTIMRNGQEIKFQFRLKKRI